MSSHAPTAVNTGTVNHSFWIASSVSRSPKCFTYLLKQSFVIISVCAVSRTYTKPTSDFEPHRSLGNER